MARAIVQAATAPTVIVAMVPGVFGRSVIVQVAMVLLVKAPLVTALSAVVQRMVAPVAIAPREIAAVWPEPALSAAASKRRPPVEAWLSLYR